MIRSSATSDGGFRQTLTNQTTYALFYYRQYIKFIKNKKKGKKAPADFPFEEKLKFETSRWSPRSKNISPKSNCSVRVSY